MNKIKTLYNIFLQRGIKFDLPKLPANADDEETLQEWYNKLEVQIPQYNNVTYIYIFYKLKNKIRFQLYTMKIW